MKLITKEQRIQDLEIQDMIDTQILKCQVNEAVEAAQQALKDLGEASKYLNENDVLCEY